MAEHGASVARPATGGPSAAEGRESGEATLGELVTQLSEDTTRLVRDEMRLAVLELQDKAKSAGIGAGLFGGAGLLGFLGAATLVATAVIALDLLLPLWLSALIVGLVLLAVAGIAALLGKKKLTQATPAVPERTVENVKRDVAAVKEHDQHG